MADSSRIRKSITASRAVKVWFWDTVREYTGQAVELSGDRVVALLKMGGTGMATVIPKPAVVTGLVKHLTGRVVEFRIAGRTHEVTCKGTVTELQPDFENPRRLLVFASLSGISEKSASILDSLGRGIPR
jgi:hypothetical protein